MSDEVIELIVESKSARLCVDPLQLVEYLSLVTPRLVLLINIRHSFMNHE